MKPARLHAWLASGVLACCALVACGDDTGTGGAGSASASKGNANATGNTTGPGGSTGNGAPPGSLFAQPAPWTKDVSALSPSPRSDAILGALDSLGGWGAGSFRIDFTIHLLWADASTPRRQVVGADGYCYDSVGCDAVPMPMPFPVNGTAEGSDDYFCSVADADCHILVAERDEKKLYELYNATDTGSEVEALGAFVWDLTRQYPETLRGDQCTSADAAGFPIAALLTTADEVASGEVNHALRFILPNARMKEGVFVRPATHAGAPSSDDADAPPYGVRFRLKASFDEAPFNDAERVVLRALKRYGMLLSDGGNIALTFGDDRLATAKWDTLGIDSFSFETIAVGDFEVVDLGDEIPLTYDCVPDP